MLSHPRNRPAASRSLPARRPRSIQRSVARIYGPPDETVSIGSAEAWYYYRTGVAFLFVGREISTIFSLRPSHRAG